jgi:hypothetical protein
LTPSDANNGFSKLLGLAESGRPVVSSARNKNKASETTASAHGTGTPYESLPSMALIPEVGAKIAFRDGWKAPNSY